MIADRGYGSGIRLEVRPSVRTYAARTRARGLLLLIAAFLFIFGGTASASELSSRVVDEYREDFGVSAERAKANLEIQERGAGIVNQLQHALGDRYAGVWFDNEAGEFVVPTLPGVEGPFLHEQMVGATIGNSYRTDAARFSWAELDSAQGHLNRALDDLVEEGLVQTFLDPRANKVVIRTGKISGQAEARVFALLNTEIGNAVAVRRADVARFHTRLLACSFTPSLCDPPLRGGQGMWPSGTTFLPDQATCSVGFKAIGKAYGNRFVLTAGHCIPPQNYMSFTPATTPGYIGAVEQYVAPPASDYAKLNATGNYWDKPSWPSLVAFWGTNQEYPISSEGYSYLGQYVCHAGANSGASCGYVTALDMTSPQPEGDMHHRTEVQLICTKGGDSGGPVFTPSGNTALGLFTADNTGVNGETPKYCQQKGYYTEITEATDAMNVSVGTRIGSAPWATTNSATNVGPYQATLNGKINPNLVETNYHFDWGASTYTNQNPFPDGNAGHGNGVVEVSTTIYELKPTTTYNFRLDAHSAAGTGYGTNLQFTTPAGPPKAITEGTSNVTGGKATLAGRVNPSGAETSYRFEWGPTTAYGNSVPVPDGKVASGINDVAVQAAIQGLKGLTTYHYRLIAENSKGKTNGVDKTFTTPDWRPSPTTEAASSIGPAKATLKGKVNPNSLSTTYRFEWGTTTAYGNSIPVPDASVGSGTSAVSVSQTLEGLEPETTYHYRLAATNAEATVYGTDKAFTTTASTITNPASGLDAHRATLRGVVNPIGSATSYQFEYGPTTSYGSKVPAVAKSVSSGSEYVAVSERISGLLEKTTYHYRIVASNAKGKTYYGKDQALSTTSTAFKTGAYPGYVTATQSGSEGEFLFESASYEVTCPTSSFHGTIDSVHEESLWTELWTQSCYGSPLFSEFTIVPNGCRFELHPGTKDEIGLYFEGMADLVCPSGQTMTIEKPTCQIDVLPQAFDARFRNVNGTKVEFILEDDNVKHIQEGTVTCPKGTFDYGSIYGHWMLEAETSFNASLPIQITERYAAPHLQAAAYPANLFGDGLETLAVAGSSITCSSSTLQGQLGNDARELALNGSYGGCSTNTGLPTTVAMNSCRYALGVLNAGPPYKGALAVVCAQAGDAILYTVYSQDKSTVLCTLKMGAQPGGTGLSLSYASEGAALSLSGEAKGFEYEKSGVCGKETVTNATLSGSATLASKDNANQSLSVSIFGEEAALGAYLSGEGAEQEYKQPRLKAESNPVTLMGDGFDFFTPGNPPAVICGSNGLLGEVPKETKQLSLVATYGGCTAGEWNVVVAMNSCRYALGVLNAGPPYKGALGVTCAIGGDAIEYNAYASGGALACTITVGAQSGKEGLTLSNFGTGNERGIKAAGEVTGIAYQKSGPCGSAAGTNGVLSGEATLVGWW